MGTDDASKDLEATHDPEAFRRLGHALIDVLSDHLRLAQKGGLPVLPWASPDAMAERWPASFGTRGDAVALVERVLGDAVHQHHPRYMGHQVAVPFPTAALLELAGAVLNNGMAAYESGPVSTAMERNVARWLAERLGFPAGADGFLTSGGTLGTLTALLCARQARAGYDIWEEGQSGGPLALLCSEHAHYAVARAAQVMGWGKRGAVAVPVDEAGRMRAAAVERALGEARAGGRRVIAVVATAGSSPVGAFDPLPELTNLCQKEDLWLHVDGAHGASVALSARYRHLLAGIEGADSVVWDAHKLLGLPALSTAVLFRDGARSFEAFSQQAEYLFYAEGERPWHDLALRNLECTKRMMSLTLYGALQVIGPDVMGEYVTRQLDLARDFARLVDQQPDFELAVQPEANIVCFRHVPTSAPDTDARQDSLRRAVVESGGFYLTRTKLAGRTYLRVTLMSPHTTHADLEALLVALRAADRGH